MLFLYSLLQQFRHDYKLVECFQGSLYEACSAVAPCPFEEIRLQEEQHRASYERACAVVLVAFLRQFVGAVLVSFLQTGAYRLMARCTKASSMRFFGILSTLPSTSGEQCMIAGQWVLSLRKKRRI